MNVTRTGLKIENGFDVPWFGHVNFEIDSSEV